MSVGNKYLGTLFDRLMLFFFRFHAIDLFSIMKMIIKHNDNFDSLSIVFLTVKRPIYTTLQRIQRFARTFF